MHTKKIVNNLKKLNNNLSVYTKTPGVLPGIPDKKLSE